jgi:membrane-bound lytic murein transglycosylase D
MNIEKNMVSFLTVVQHFATDTVMIKKEMSFKQISDLLEVPMAQQLLNPSYKLNIIPSYKDEKHYLRLPNEKLRYSRL